MNMAPIVDIQNISKKYIISHTSKGYNTLVETLSQKAKQWVSGRRSSPPDPSRGREEFWALKEISFQIHPGDRLGIIGKNGAGKSTLLKILARITYPTHGQIKMRGRVASLLEVGTGFHPELTGRENIFLNGAILGMKRKEIQRKFDDIVAFADVEKFLDTPVKRFSSGMYTRLGFAIAAHLDPDLLIVDEVLAVGDALFQEKCLKTLSNLSSQEGRTIIFVSHDVGSVLNLCNRGLWLDHGEARAFGPVESIVQKYTQSYRHQGLSWEGNIGDEHIRFFRIALIPSAPFREFYYQDEKPLIELEYEVIKSDPNLCIGLGVWNQRNQLLARAHTMDDADPVVDLLCKGVHKVSFQLDAKLFHEGEYMVKLDCFVHNKKHIVRDEASLKFSVFPRKKNTRFHSHPGIQGIHLGNQWTPICERPSA
jgi:lipopolysaccharide transport system ATP-binding protein